MYNKKKLQKEAEKAITENNLLFIEDVIAVLGISKPTFYKYFPSESNEINYLKSILTKNKALIKIDLRKKWQVSGNSTMQLALYKLICDPDERKKLSVSYNEVAFEETKNLVRIEDIYPRILEVYPELAGADDIL